MKFHVETVNALTPALQNIEDLHRLEQLLLDAAQAQNLEVFEETLHE